MSKPDFKVHSMRDMTSELYISVLEKIILRACIAMNNGNAAEAQTLLKSFVDNSGIATDLAKVEGDEYIIMQWLEGDLWRVVNRTTGQYANMTLYDGQEKAQAEADRLNGKGTE